MYLCNLIDIYGMVDLLLCEWPILLWQYLNEWAYIHRYKIMSHSLIWVDTWNEWLGGNRTKHVLRLINQVSASQLITLPFHSLSSHLLLYGNKTKNQILQLPYFPTNFSSSTNLIIHHLMFVTTQFYYIHVYIYIYLKFVKFVYN